MRIAVLILGLLLGLLMFFQTFLVYILSNVGESERGSTAGAIGLLMALLWLLACALVIPAPLVSVFIFGLAGLLGFASAADFPDLKYWGVASFVLASMSILGWIGKRKAARKERERDQTLARIASHTAPNYGPTRVVATPIGTEAPATLASDSCRRCGTALAPSDRFCRACGAPLNASPTSA
jgi:hypothetical protein